MTDRALLYLRVSTHTQADNYSLPTQSEGCLARAAERGYTVAGEFSDTASGEWLERPGLTSLLERAGQGDIQVVLVYDLDRLTRDPMHLAILELELANQAVRVEYVLGDYTSSNEGELTKHIKAAIAQYENRQRQERSRRGKRARAKAGHVTVHPQHPPYGYRYVSEPGAGWLEVDETAAEIVRWLFSQIAQGVTVYALATRLMNEGVPPPAKRARCWWPSSIARLLRNPVYKGEWTYGQERSVQVNGRRVRTPAPVTSHIIVPVPAVVSEETWAAAQSVLAAAPSRRRSAKHLLSGRLICSCGRTWEVRVASPTRRYYRCPSVKERHIRQACTLAGSIRADVLEDAAWQAVAGLVFDEGKLAEQVRRRTEQQAQHRSRLREQLEKLTQRKQRLDCTENNLLDRMLAGADPGAIGKQQADLRIQRSRLEDEIAHVTGLLDRPEDERPENGVVALVKQLRTGWEALTLSGRRTVLDTLGIRIDVVSLTEVRLHDALGLLDVTLQLPPGRRPATLRRPYTPRRTPGKKGDTP